VALKEAEQTIQRAHAATAEQATAGQG